MFSQRLPDFPLIGSANGRVLAVLHVVLHLDCVVADDQGIFAPALL